MTLQYFKPILLILLFNVCGSAFSITSMLRANPDHNPEFGVTNTYSADIAEGLIGISNDMPIDNPGDNVFQVQIDELPSNTMRVWMSYDLYGVQDHTAVSRSVNDGLSQGGYLVKRSEKWNGQKEELDIKWMKTGVNTIRFSIPQNANYQYRIRNLKITTSIYAEDVNNSSLEKRELVINQSGSFQYFDGQGYLKGFIKGSGSEQAKIYVDGQLVESNAAAFECLIKKPAGAGAAWEVPVVAMFLDGSIVRNIYSFKESVQADYVNLLENYATLRKQKWVSYEAASLKLKGAFLQFPEAAISQTTLISITALRPIDLVALDQSMINVTGYHAGYRFLPHGSQFEKEAKVTLDYEESKIPLGYTAKDIRTFYFDEKARHWYQLQRVGLDEENKKITSLTSHFTDMINGVIMVPESPQTEGYTPTTMNEILAADPSAKIPTIEPPTANNWGSANLEFPITLPDGRQSMQPEVTIRYNSEADHSWLGTGWDLQIPQIRIETRWGVPRYSEILETETYVFNGEQLSPVAHRATAVPRTSEKEFHPRVEGNFDKIIRHGNSPKNYWWEVINKNGIRNFYGGLPGIGVIQNSTLQDGQGNLAQWALVETRDLNDNFVRYECSRVFDAGVPGASNIGYTIYIEKITYTGYGTTQGKYSVQFTRDRELQEALRMDKRINGRLGFKQVEADLLRKIEVKLNGQNIRSYELNYGQGAFYKTLLENISEFDASGVLYNTHTFDYYDDVRNGTSYAPLASPETWNPKNDKVSGTFLNPIPLFTDDASALSGNKSIGGGFGMVITAGPFDGNLAMKTNTAGVAFAFNISGNEGMLAIVDINGDGLIDKVFKKNGNLYYRANQSGPNGSVVFGMDEKINGINDFSRGLTFNGEIGVESHFGVFAGGQYSGTRNITSVYFSDVNGDRLIDIIKDGRVYFNHINALGKPTFTTSSGDTPSPINAAASIDPALVDSDPDELENAIDDNPLHDVVRMWRAPYDGFVSIDAPVALIQDASPDGISYTAADGVRVAIQLANQELWFTTIDADDFTTKTPIGLNLVQVDAGDQIYFRVQSVFDGAYDQVNWTPIITYSNHNTSKVDANGLAIYQFNVADDFLLTAPMAVGMTIPGKIKIEGNFVKPITSDNVTAKIIRHSGGGISTLWSKNLNWNSTANESISFSQNILEGDNIYFQVISQTNIDWAAIEWSPYIYYESSADPDITQVFNDNGDPLLDFYPVVDCQSFNKSHFPSKSWTVPNSDTFEIIPRPIILPNFEIGDILFSVKKNNELIAKQNISVTFGSLGSISPMNIILNGGDKIYFEYHTSNGKLGNNIFSPGVWIDSSQTVIAGLHSKRAEGSIYGPLYRHWGQFVYNGNRNRANQPIKESNLKLDESITDPPEIDLSGASDFEEMNNMYDGDGGNQPKDNKFVYLYPDAEFKAWRGYDNLTYVQRNVISSSRMGQDDILPFNPIVVSGSGAGSGAVGITKVAVTDNGNFAVGIGSAGVSASIGRTRQLYDFIDMNGDSYPDIVSKDKIQYTFPYGGLEPTARGLSFGEVHQATHFSLGFTLGGTYLNSGSKNSNNSRKGEKAGQSQSESEISAGITGNFSLNNDNTSFAWMDINGDGLPDRVHSQGMVELNIGYDFLSAEQWGYNGISDGEAISYGAGLSVNISNYSITAGIGLSRSENEVKETLQDMNGDGLLDYIEDASPLSVAINTGNGFAAAVQWQGADAIRKGTSTGESVNAAFTACIPLVPPIVVAKLCFNPQINVSQGADRSTVQIEDIDGDGFPDYLQSDKDNKLTVSRSTIQRTNKLKTVNRPLGAHFTLDYDRKGNVYNMPNHIWTLSSVDFYDGYQFDGADNMLSRFSYEDGIYDRHERDFYGFKKLISTQHDTENGNALYRSIVHEYLNDNYYERGLKKSETLVDADGNKFTEHINKYAIKDLNSGANLPDAFKELDDAAAFPALIKTESSFYEGQDRNVETTSFTFEYDLLGNIIRYIDFGDSDGADDFITTISYHSFLNNYLVDKPNTITVSGNGEIYRHREMFIIPSTGNIKEIRKYLEGGAFATYNFSHDVYGNLLDITRPENETGQRLQYQYEYDPEVNTYITKISDSYGYSSSSTYDYRFGEMLSNLDINAQQTNYVIDDIGRVVSITGPFEIEAGIPFTLDFEYHPEAEVPWALTRHYDPQHPNNFLETATFIDGFKRVIQTKKDGAIFQGARMEDKEMMLVSGTTIYDAFDRKVEQFYPITETKGTTGIINLNQDNIPSTKTTFDVMDRPLTNTLPDLASTTFNYGLGIDRDGNVQLRRLVIDANDIWKETYFNVRGLKTAVKEQYSQGSDIWTSYAFNPVNELTTVVDDQGNVINIAYDRFGRKISTDHPSSGLTTFDYALSGNLTQKTTANLQDAGIGITYEYDHERLISIFYPENPENNVSYKYGEMGATDNRASRIFQIRDESGYRELFYDALGAVIKNNRVINIPDMEPLSYTTEWTYDTWNRLTGMIYPDQEILSYQYNLGGLLYNMAGFKDDVTYQYLIQLGYDKFESKIYQSYGNATESIYTYEPDRRRLQTLTTETATDRKILDVAYTYDKDNNLVLQSNHAPIPIGELMGGSYEYAYSYDDLYRLTNTMGEYQDNKQEHRFDLTMEYNSIHNIINKDQFHEGKKPGEQEWTKQVLTTYDFQYEYDTGNQPHTPVHIGEQSYSYDASGNHTSSQHDVISQLRELNWDEEHRIQSITDNGQTFSYTYDDGFERVIKSNAREETINVNGNAAAESGGLGNNTIYVNPFMVIRTGEVTKHYYMGNTRIASKWVADPSGFVQIADTNADGDPGHVQGHNGIGNGEVIDGNKQAAFSFFYHSDHLGNSAYITDAFGEVYQHLEYFPFGETMIEEHYNKDRTPYLFSGKELDDETGLYHYGTRYYDPKTNIWESPDPDWQDANQPGGTPYAYLENNPISIKLKSAFQNLPASKDNAASNSFVEDTEIITANGILPIQNIEVGDEVYGYSEKTGETSTYLVAELFRRVAQAVLFIAMATDTIAVTPEHPFYHAERGWLEARELVAGDRLFQRDGSSSDVLSITRSNEPATVYNFEVSGVHNYFVTEQGFLVHNPKGEGVVDLGGKHSQTSKHSEKHLVESNHFPASSSYEDTPYAGMTRGSMPAVTMDYDDHRVAATTGSSHAAKKYREKQRKLLKKRKFASAMEMDIRNMKAIVKASTGDRHYLSDGLTQAVDYAAKMKHKKKPLISGKEHKRLKKIIKE